ncbi:MAG: hypothetical protein ACTSP4_07070 [Candidatus Hodarchaeales archaeon]
MKSLYYSHSMFLYGTRGEQIEISQIKQHFPGLTIINPSEIDLGGRESEEAMEYFYQLIAKSEIVIITEYKCSIGRGVYSEAIYALKSNIAVFLLKWGELHVISEHNLVRCNTADWAIHYAVIRGIKGFAC